MPTDMSGNDGAEDLVPDSLAESHATSAERFAADMRHNDDTQDGDGSDAEEPTQRTLAHEGLDASNHDSESRRPQSRMTLAIRVLRKYWLPITAVSCVVGIPLALDAFIAWRAARAAAAAATAAAGKVGTADATSRRLAKAAAKAAMQHSDRIVEAYPPAPAWIRRAGQVRVESATWLAAAERFVDAVLLACGAPSLAQLRRSGLNSGADGEGGDGADDDGGVGVSAIALTLAYTAGLFFAAKAIGGGGGANESRRGERSSLFDGENGGRDTTTAADDDNNNASRASAVPSADARHPQMVTIDEYRDFSRGSSTSATSFGMAGVGQAHTEMKRLTANRDETAGLAPDPSSDFYEAQQRPSVLLSNDRNTDDIDTGRYSRASSEPTHGERILDSARQTPRTSMLRTVDSAARSNQRLHDALHNGHGRSNHYSVSPSSTQAWGGASGAPGGSGVPRFMAVSESPSSPPVPPLPMNPAPFARTDHRGVATLPPSQSASPLTRDDLRKMPPNMHPPTPPSHALNHHTTVADANSSQSQQLFASPLHRSNTATASTMDEPQSPTVVTAGVVSVGLVLPPSAAAEVASMRAAAEKYRCREVLVVRDATLADTAAAAGAGSVASTASDLQPFDMPHLNAALAGSQVPFRIFGRVSATSAQGVFSPLASAAAGGPATSSSSLSLRHDVSSGDGTAAPVIFAANSSLMSYLLTGAADQVCVAVHRWPYSNATRDALDESPRRSSKLYDFTHPTNAVYFFVGGAGVSNSASKHGAASLDADVEAQALAFCGVHVHVSEPGDQAFTALSSIVNITLYDRSVKLKRKQQQQRY